MKTQNGIVDNTTKSKKKVHEQYIHDIEELERLQRALDIHIYEMVTSGYSFSDVSFALRGLSSTYAKKAFLHYDIPANRGGEQS